MNDKNSPYSLLLFDGYCNLCSGSVIFILKRERGDVFRFASLQSEYALGLLKNYHLEDDAPDSIILIENNKLYYKSTAALRITRKLKWPWPFLYGFLVVPRFFRDWIYDWIAKNRYKWFGQKEICFVPEQDVRYKFLD